MFRLFAHPVACCSLFLGVVAQSLKPVKLLSTCKRDATTPNDVGQTMLGVVASVCTLLKITITKVVETSIESDCQKFFRTTLTRTIMVYLLINRLLGSKLSQPKKWLSNHHNGMKGKQN